MQKPETPPRAALKEAQAESVRWEGRTPITVKAGSWWLLVPEAWLLLPLQICYQEEIQCLAADQGLEAPSSAAQYLSW